MEAIGSRAIHIIHLDSWRLLILVVLYSYCHNEGMNSLPLLGANRSVRRRQVGDAAFDGCRRSRHVEHGAGCEAFELGLLSHLKFSSSHSAARACGDLNPRSISCI